MFTYYTKQEREDGTITFIKADFDLSAYNAEFDSEGNITMKPKIVTVADVSASYSDICFTKSSVIACSIQEQDQSVLLYNPILRKIYDIIGQGTKIILHSTMNITTTNKSDKGFIYIPKLGISVQNACATKTVQEIMTQVQAHNIPLNMQVRLADGRLVQLVNNA